MIWLITSIYSYIYWYIRPIFKWFLRRTTKLCELQRVCYGDEFGFRRTNNIDMSLILSRNSEVKEMIQHFNNLTLQGKFIDNVRENCLDYAINLIIEIKVIQPAIHKTFLNSFYMCLLQIYGYKQLTQEIEKLREIPYSAENLEHEEKLLKLWKLLKPEEPLQNRISKQWADIGFQGDDPKTDFRGMGLLGLENLLYFASNYTDAARHVLSHSNHPNYGYSFAIVGINLTKMAYHLLKDQVLKVHFYNVIKGSPEINDFHYVYCYLFYEFDKFWLSEKPRDIMEFYRIRTKFEAFLLKRLENPKAKLKLNFVIETL